MQTHFNTQTSARNPLAHMIDTTADGATTKMSQMAAAHAAAETAADVAETARIKGEQTMMQRRAGQR